MVIRRGIDGSEGNWGWLMVDGEGFPLVENAGSETQLPRFPQGRVPTQKEGMAKGSGWQGTRQEVHD